MTELRVVLITTAVVTIALLLRLLRRNYLRERYAALWLVLAPLVIVLAAFPHLFNQLAHKLGIAYPPNLLFFLACIVLLLVSVRLSVELSALEDRTRALAEELAILRASIDERERETTS